MRWMRFAVLVMACAVWLVPTATAKVDPKIVYETLTDWGVSATLDGRRLHVEGYTQGNNNGYVDEVEVRLYIYRADGSLGSASAPKREGGTYVSTWFERDLLPGTYTVKARHRGWNVSGGRQTEWSEFWQCFEVQ